MAQTFRMTAPRIGTAGWAIPGAFKARFPAEGSHLEKYSRVFNAVEINSCFYREHKPQTYRRWAEETPPDFSFSLKLLKEFTHQGRLEKAGDRLREVLNGHAQLGEKWGALLIQLPPSLAFHEKTVDRFLAELRRHYDGALFCEPRHPTWATEQALLLLARYRAGKVRADPEPCPLPATVPEPPGPGLYLRMHGSPEIYKSEYPLDALKAMANAMNEARAEGRETWCIFDNTTFGHSIENARDLAGLFGAP